MQITYSVVPAGLWITQPQQPGCTCSSKLLETGIPAKEACWFCMRQIHLYLGKATRMSEKPGYYYETNITHSQATSLIWITMILSTFFPFPAFECSCNCLVFLNTFWVLWQNLLLSAIFGNSSNKYHRYLLLHII